MASRNCGNTRFKGRGTFPNPNGADHTDRNRSSTAGCALRRHLPPTAAPSGTDGCRLWHRRFVEAKAYRSTTDVSTTVTASTAATSGGSIPLLYQMRVESVRRRDALRALLRCGAWPAAGSGAPEGMCRVSQRGSAAKSPRIPIGCIAKVEMRSGTGSRSAGEIPLRGST